MNALAIAFDSIWSHRTRSALTALGVVIGVFAVVTLTSLGTAVSNYVTGQFNTLGARIITVSPSLPAATGGAHAPGRRGGPNGFVQVPSTLTATDAQAIAAAGAGSIAAVAPVADLPATVATSPTGSAGIQAVGTTNAYFGIEQATFAHGRFDGRGAVLGSRAATTLFPGVRRPLGRDIYVDGRAFAVVGVLNAGKGILGDQIDRNVFVPVSAGLSLVKLTTVSEIIVGARTNGGVNAAARVTTRVLTARHPNRDFAVIKSTAILSTIQSTLSTITTFLSGLAAISLLVGGIGIMNIMLVTVTERFREIGIRKALGARDGDILVQFLSESVLLAVLGGAVGTALSAVAGGIIAHLAGFPAGLTANAVVIALGFSIGVGAIFGVLPALRAARLMPAEALRSE